MLGQSQHGSGFLSWQDLGIQGSNLGSHLQGKRLTYCTFSPDPQTLSFPFDLAFGMIQSLTSISLVLTRQAQVSTFLPQHAADSLSGATTPTQGQCFSLNCVPSPPLNTLHTSDPGAPPFSHVLCYGFDFSPPQKKVMGPISQPLDTTRSLSAGSRAR